MFGVYLTKVKCTLNVDNNLSILKNKMSKITRKIELIPDIENLTHEESNQRCYKPEFGISDCRFSCYARFPIGAYYICPPNNMDGKMQEL